MQPEAKPTSNVIASLVYSLINMSVVGFVVKDCCLEAEDVGRRAKSVDTTDAGLRDHRFFPVRLSGVNVRQVDFDGIHACGGDGVLERDARVRVRRRIEDHIVEVASGLLYLRYQFALVVGLVKRYLNVMPVSVFTDHSLDIRKGHAAVNFGFALAQQVQVGAVKEHYIHVQADSYTLAALLST